MAKLAHGIAVAALGLVALLGGSPAAAGTNEWTYKPNSFAQSCSPKASLLDGQQHRQPRR